jgi:hypothetical protein
MSHIAGLEQQLKADGYELRRTGPLHWAYFDLHDESGKDVIAGEGKSPAEAGRAVLANRYQ